MGCGRCDKNTALWRMESSVAERVIKSWLEEHRIALFYDTRLREAKDAVVKRGTRIWVIFNNFPEV